MGNQQAQGRDEQDAVWRHAGKGGGEALADLPAASAYPERLLGYKGLRGRGNASMQTGLLQQMQSAYGNRQARQAVQRAISIDEMTSHVGVSDSANLDENLVRQMVATVSGSLDNSPNDEVRESYKADQMWAKLYEEYPDLRPQSNGQ